MSDIRVAVLDDRPLFRAGVVSALAAEPDITVVGEGSSPEDAVYVAEKAGPNIMLLDIPRGGHATMERVLAFCPDVKLIILGAAFEHDQVRSALQMGAWGLVLDRITGAELAQGIRQIHRGERYIGPVLAGSMLAAAAAESTEGHSRSLAGLSIREEQVLACLRRGFSNKEIGVKLRTSEKTVKRHVSTTLAKLGVKSRVQAAILVHER
jgi:DNA-binding NarL/FixJ family response regulator